MFYTTSTPFRGEHPKFLHEVNATFQKPLERIKAFCSSHYSKAFTPFLKATQKIQYVAELFFDTFLPDQRLTGLIKSIKDGSDWVLSYMADTAGKVKNIVNFLKIPSLYGKAKKNIKNRHKAKKAKDPEKKVIADLEAVSLAGKILGIPETISKFVSLIFTKAIPEIFKQFTTICNAIKLVLSAADLFAEGYSCISTTQLMDNLKTARQRAFIEKYFKEVSCDHAIDIETLTPTDLEGRVKEIENQLVDTNQKLLLDKITHSANIAFTRRLKEEIKIQPNIIKKQFKVTFAEENTDEIELGTYDHSSGKFIKKTFFDKLTSKRIQNDPARLASIVKNLELRLEDKVFADKFSIIHGSINLIPSVLGTIEALGVLIAPTLALGVVLTPIAATITGLLAIATVVNIFYQHHRQQCFIEAMEKLTTKAEESPPFDGVSKLAEFKSWTNPAPSEEILFPAPICACSH